MFGLHVESTSNMMLRFLNEHKITKNQIVFLEYVEGQYVLIYEK